MLVMLSDLHFTDGTSGETIAEGAFRIFRERLRDMAYDASWRSDGRYRPIEEVDLVLLGDIFDVIRSSSWLNGKVRPWNNPRSARFVKTIAAITDGVLRHNRESFAVFQSMVHGKGFTLPPATRAGKPALVPREPEAPERVPVKLNIHYVVGNHDWFYHLPGPGFDEVRRKIIAAMGLAGSPDSPFPHDPSESGPLRSCLEQHRVVARHGDIFDGFNFAGDRDSSSLGDAIVIELLNRFPAEVDRQFGDELPEECRLGLREIDNVRPILIAPTWVAGLLRRTCPDPDLAKKVKEVWNECADEFLALDFVRRHDTWNPVDKVDQLQLMLKFSTGISPETAGRILQGIEGLCSARKESYRKFAATEGAFKTRKARHVVYGHTHYHEIVPLAVWPGAPTLNQVYINSGTWRQVHELAQLRRREQGFVGYKVMTYLGFYKDDERKGRTFEAWSGALGE